MPWQVTPYTVPLVTATVIAVALTVYGVFYLLERDLEPSVVAFVLLMTGVSLWAVGYTLQLSSTTLDVKLRWLTVLWVGSAITPTALLAFAITYTERESWLTTPRLLALSIQPVVTVAVLAVSPTGLLWNDPALDTTSNTFATITFGLGPWYVLSLAYSWLLVVLGVGLLLWFVVDSDDMYRGQAIAIVIGSLTPFAASVVFFTGLSPNANVNPTSAAFAVSGLAFAIAVFRYRFLDVVPVARDTVVGRMRDGYIVVDDDHNVIDANPAASQLTDHDSLVGRSLSTVLPSAGTDDSPITESVSGSTEPQEFVVEDETGTRVVEVRRSEIEGQRRAGDLFLLRDITAQRQVERRYQRLIERASDIMSILDEDGRITYQSPSVERVLGHEPSLAVGELAFDVVHPEDRDEVRQAFETVLADPGTQTRVEYRVPDAGGNWRTLDAIAKNLLHDPFVEGIVLNGRDVTERKERERELEAKNERLDRFASVVSHDLRNPIQVAGANVDLAEETGDPDRFDAIRRAVDRMDRLVDDVLTLAREGTTDTEREPVHVGTIAERAWSTVETADATLDVRTERLVDADPDRFQQLFENLIRNGVEHGRDDVSITVGDCPDGGFFVADDGPGIPPAERERVFESGFSTDPDGTGFGLAIVSRIAETHGWTVCVSESDSGGARFEFGEEATS
ncbi:MAG: histidine kinase N-terminal 7TM domain-containing protein [Halorientalis sp.]